MTDGTETSGGESDIPYLATVQPPSVLKLPPCTTVISLYKSKYPSLFEHNHMIRASAFYERFVSGHYHEIVIAF